MDRRIFLAGGLAAMVAAPEIALAQRRDWVLLGRRPVNWGLTRDSIILTRREPMSALSFRTRGSEIILTDIEVFFQRGRTERFPARTRIRPNSTFNQINLRTRDRPVSRVEFRYSMPNRRRINTTLDLYGRPI